MYQAAIRSHPSTVNLRVSYLVGRAARWGGSAAEIQQVVADAKNLPEGDRRYIEAEANAQMAIDAQNYEGIAAAVPLNERALALCPAYTGSARRLVYAYAGKRHPAKVLQLSNRILEQQPTDGEAYAYRAWAYGNDGKFNEAFADYQRATQLGYAKAYLELAGFYQMGIGGAPRDLQKALELCTAAEDKGVDGGKACADRMRGLMKRNP
jgi:tetratricopeptide (TPR) repeat protein